MPPIGQIFNFNYGGDFQNRGTEHMPVLIYIADASKIDENEDSELQSVA